MTLFNGSIKGAYSTPPLGNDVCSRNLCHQLLQREADRITDQVGGGKQAKIYKCTHFVTPSTTVEGTR